MSRNMNLTGRHRQNNDIGLPQKFGRNTVPQTEGLNEQDRHPGRSEIKANSGRKREFK